MRRANPYGYDQGTGQPGPSSARPPQHYASESLAVPYDGSRQARPTGELEPLEVSQLHARFFVKGVVEANNVENILEAMATSKTIQANFVKNSVLQIVLLLSAIVFDHILLPSVRGSGSSTVRVLFQIFWLWPVTVASFLVSGVGNLRTAAAHPQSASVSYHARSLSTFISDQSSRGTTVDYRGLTARMIEESYRVLLLANYVVGVAVLRRIPVPGLGTMLAFVYAAMVNSYYLWESRWTEQGLTLKDRVKSLEQRYTYHLGFGLVITLASFWHSNFFFNLSLFSLLFPLFSLNSSSPASHPVPLSSRYPLSTTHSSSPSTTPGIEPTVPDLRSGFRSPPWVPTRIPLLAPAAAVHAFLVKVLSPTSGAGRSAGRIRQSRRKDREMEEMEGGGPEDDDLATAAASSAVGAGPSTSFSSSSAGFGYGPENGSVSSVQPTIPAPPPPVGGFEAPHQADASTPAVVPPPPPPVRKRNKAD